VDEHSVQAVFCCAFWPVVLLQVETAADKHKFQLICKKQIFLCILLQSLTPDDIIYFIENQDVVS
jgi:hypothetical protein